LYITTFYSTASLMYRETLVIIYKLISEVEWTAIVYYCSVAT